jgi:hypothetical protein
LIRYITVTLNIADGKNSFIPLVLSLPITWPTSGGRLVGIVRSRTQTMEFSFSLVHGYYVNRTGDRLMNTPVVCYSPILPSLYNAQLAL